MCYRIPCNGINVHNLNVCKVHLEEIAGRISEGCPRLSPKQTMDYAKIYAVITDGVTLDTALRYLGDKIAGFEANAANNDAVKLDEMPILHFLLKSYEEKFGFGRDALMTGILSPEAFLKQLEEAYSVCDFGADADHGAFTHRLHWFAVMYAATGGSPENGTPGPECLAGGFTIPVVNLYKTLGTGPAGSRVVLLKANGSNDAGKSLWAALFDLPGEGAGRFNHPDALHLAIRTEEVGHPALSAAIIDIQRDVVKRRLRVLNTLQFIGAVTVSPQRTKGGESDKLSERQDLINEAIVGGNLVTFMRYRDVQPGNVGDGEFKPWSSRPTGNFYPGEDKDGFARRVSNAAIQNLAKSILEGGRWKWEFPNLLVRTQRMNSMGEMVNV